MSEDLSVIDFFEESDEVSSYARSSGAVNLDVDDDELEEEEFAMPDLADLGDVQTSRDSYVPMMVESSDYDYSGDWEEEETHPGVFNEFDYESIVLPDVEDGEDIDDEDTPMPYVESQVSDVNYTSGSDGNNFSNLIDSEIDDSDIDDPVRMNSGDSIDDIYDSVDDDDYDEEDEVKARPSAEEIEASIGYKPSAFGSEIYDLSDEDDLREFQKFNIEAALSRSIDDKADDTHINVNEKVAFTINNEIVKYDDFGIITSNQALLAYEMVTNNKIREVFVTELELDTSYVLRTGVHKGRRFRLNIARSLNEISITARVISNQIPTPEELKMDSRIESWSRLPNGLVLICGPTGSGKSTSFAAIIDRIRITKAKKIVTVEKPIEYEYARDGKSLVVQREVGADTISFSNALKSAMRQNPDIILVGEVRDREEFDELLRASESGHLAMSTMHTNSPAATIDRIKSLYQGDEQARILGSLRSNLRGIANQILIRTIDGGRMAIQVVLEVTPAVAKMVGLGDSDAILDYMKVNKMTLEDELTKAILDKKVSYEEAMEHTVDPSYLNELLSEAGYDINWS